MAFHKQPMSREREGELLMLSQTFFESWFPIVSLFLVGIIGSLYAYALTNLFALLVFATLVVYRKRLNEFCNTAAYKDLLLTSFFITLLFTLIFLGLHYTTAGNMAVIIFLQLVFSYLYFNMLGHEKMSPLHTFGAFIMGAGALIVLFPKEYTFNAGDLLILAAAAVAPIANLYQKRARTHVSSETILAFRTLVSLPLLFGLAYWTEAVPSSEALGQVWWLLLINGILLMGISKILWVEALHRISITKVSALLALSPLFTLLFAYLTLDETPSLQQAVGILPILVGGYLITRPVDAA